MEQFYRLNPKLFMRYQPFMTEWAKNYHYSRTEMGWITGRYVSHAVGANFSKSHRYPSMPEAFYDFGRAEEAPGEEKLTDFDRFKAFAMMFNKQFARKAKQSTDVAAETEGTAETDTVKAADALTEEATKQEEDT